jgi:putative ABC transport system substrate-binding protein
MRRRDFIIAGLGSAAAGPLAAQDQRLNRSFRVGVLANEEWPPLNGLRDGLRDLGYIEGQTLELVNRYAEGYPTRYPGFARELVGLPVDVIVTWGTPASLAAKDATAAIPIIMTSGDPIRCRSRSRLGAAARKRHGVLDAGSRTGRQAA